MGRSGQAAEPTEEDVRGWLTPHQAIAYLGGRLDPQTARRAIITRLMGSMFRCYALNYVLMTGNRDINRGGLVAVDNSYWQDGHSHISYRFWDTGDVEFEVYAKKSLFFDIRFETSGIEAMAPRLLASSPFGSSANGEPGQKQAQTAGGPDRSKPVSRADLERFGGLMVAVYPEVTEVMATRIVKAMFPDSAISRDQIRALLPPRKPGRPASRVKVGE